MKLARCSAQRAALMYVTARIAIRPLVKGSFCAGKRLVKWQLSDTCILFSVILFHTLGATSQQTMSLACTGRLHLHKTAKERCIDMPIVILLNYKCWLWSIPSVLSGTSIELHEVITFM